MIHLYIYILMILYYFENYAKYLIEEYDYIFYVSPEGVQIEDNGIREINGKSLVRWLEYKYGKGRNKKLVI